MLPRPIRQVRLAIRLVYLAQRQRALLANMIVRVDRPLGHHSIKKTLLVLIILKRLVLVQIHRLRRLLPLDMPLGQPLPIIPREHLRPILRPLDELLAPVTFALRQRASWRARLGVAL